MTEQINSDNAKENHFSSSFVHTVHFTNYLYCSLKDPQAVNFIPLEVKGNFSCNTSIQRDKD